jgi:MSHA biogenesis protein MshJ
MNLSALRQWWTRRKPRERVLVIAVALLALGWVMDTLLWQPLGGQIEDSRLRLATARAELDKLQRIVEERDRDGSENLRARKADLEARMSAAQSEIHRAQIELIAPQDMERQLSAILRQFPQLRVVGMASEPPALVDESAEKNGKAVNAEARRSMLYQHGLELTVEGHYMDLISYLDQLEHAPYRIYWRELDMKADPKGTLVTRIRFFTLSKGPTWLTL